MKEYELPPSPLQEWADLRQAVEWIALGRKPIPIAYDEAERGKIQNIQSSDSAEITHAKKWLFTYLFEGKIIATGQKEDANFLGKDKFHKIPESAWRFNQIKWNANKLVIPDESGYINVRFITDDLFKIFPYPFLKTKTPSMLNTRDGYISAYMLLMEEAIKNFNITDQNQPPIKILVPWFRSRLEQMPEEPHSPEHKAKVLATLVRQPASQKGGLTKNKHN